MKRHVVFIQNVMAGGGAERHVINIINYLVSQGWSAQILLTAMKMDEIVTLFDLDERVSVDSLVESVEDCSCIRQIGDSIHGVILKCFTWFYCRILPKKRKPKWLLKANYCFDNRRIIAKIREKINGADDKTVLLTTLDAPTFQTLYANEKINAKHVVAEFADPYRKIESSQFIAMMFEDYFPQVDCAIFQTLGAMSAFNEEVQKKGVIIPNPLSDHLIPPYHGNRKKEIVNFCRFSEQKNIPLLIQAFSMLHKDFPEYKLVVYGGATNDEEERCVQVCNQLVKELKLGEAVLFPGFCNEVHQKIMDAAMFVSSSDYEGLSNSMIEAMAIGLPTVCTDCPAGGASFIIEDGISGLLAPVGDAEKLYRAMKRIIEEEGLAKTLSENAVKVRERLKLQRIAEEWKRALDV